MREKKMCTNRHVHGMILAAQYSSKLGPTRTNQTSCKKDDSLASSATNKKWKLPNNSNSRETHKYGWIWTSSSEVKQRNEHLPYDPTEASFRTAKGSLMRGRAWLPVLEHEGTQAAPSGDGKQPCHEHGSYQIPWDRFKVAAIHPNITSIMFF